MRLPIIVGHGEELQVAELTLKYAELRFGFVAKAIGNFPRLAHVMAIQLLPERQ